MMAASASRLADTLLEDTVVGSFSSIGWSVRSRLLPEFTEADHPSFAGRVALITGATSGIGRAVATRLAGLGGTVHFLARDQGRAQRAQSQIAAASGNDAVSYGIADLDDLDSVREFARDFRAAHDRLDVLIHNAGAIHPGYATTDDGTELTVAGQVIDPFALTALLLPLLKSAAPSRVITVASGGMYTQRPVSAGSCDRSCARPTRARTRSSGSPPPIHGGWAAAGSGTTGGPGPSTCCRGPGRPARLRPARCGTASPGSWRPTSGPEVRSGPARDAMAARHLGGGRRAGGGGQSVPYWTRRQPGPRPPVSE